MGFCPSLQKSGKAYYELQLITTAYLFYLIYYSNCKRGTASASIFGKYAVVDSKSQLVFQI